MKKIAYSVVALAIALGLASSASAATFTTNLTVGSTGSDVVALQSWLVSTGYLNMPAGVAMGYFGQITKGAVASYQAKAGLPATGFFGPLTRASLAAMGTVTTYPVVTGCPVGFTCTPTVGSQPVIVTPGTIVNDGSDGTLSVTYSPYAPSSQTLKKGDMNKSIVAVKLQATSGRVSLNRLDVDFSDRPWLFFSKISLKDSAGNIIATKSISNSADATEITVGTDYRVRFDNVNYTVTPGQDATLVVYLDVLAASDKINNNNVYIGIPTGNIRSINGKGYTDSLGISSGTGSGVTSSTGVTILLSSSGSTGTVTTRLSPSTPLKRTVATSATAVTSDVTLGVFGIKVQNQNGVINQLNFHTLNSTSVATTTVFSNVRLYDSATGALIAGANSLSAGSPTFNNLNIPVTADVWKDLTVKADININQTGLSASTTLDGGLIVGTDSNYNTLTVTSASNQTASDIVLSTSGIVVATPSMTVGTCTASYSNGLADKCDITASFTITNVGNSDIYISKTPGIALSTSTTPSTSSTTLTAINILAASNDTTASYAVGSNSTRTFTYTGTFAKTGGAPATETFSVAAIKFGTIATNGASDNGSQNTTSSTNTASLINFGLEPLVVSKSL